MIIRKYLAEFLAALVIVLRRFILLMVFPYKTMRQISQEDDYWPLLVIFTFVFVYFKFVYFLRDKPYPATLIFLFFLINFFLTTGFFYFFGRFFNKKLKFITVISLFAYTLFPTLIWFYSTSLLYLILPPPRTWSLAGKLFSILYLTYSLSLLAWKIVLFYLAIRFSSKASFYQIGYQIIIYLAWFIPLTVFFYQFRFFRVPFI